MRLNCDYICEIPKNNVRNIRSKMCTEKQIKNCIESLKSIQYELSFIIVGSDFFCKK